MMLKYFVASASLLIASCGASSKKTDEETQVSAESGPGKLNLSLTADGLGSSLASGSAFRLASVETEQYGYPGIGMNYGDAIVEGFRVKLKTISLQSHNEETGGFASRAALMDFGSEMKVLEISEGFNGKIEVSKEIEIPSGKYTQMSVSTENAFELKAYAYLDQNNDGTIDATLWTTAAGTKMVTQKLAVGSMPDYGWQKHNWLIATLAKSTTDNSATPVEHTTQLPAAIEITADGLKSGETFTKTLTVNLLVDTFRAIKAWDGRFQAGNINNWTPGSGNASNIPPPVFPFPQGLNDSRTAAEGMLKTYELYPPNKPHFALGNYLSMFSFVNQTGVKAQNYIISKTSSITPYNSQLLTLISDADGKPLFAKFGLGESNDTLHIGPVGRAFEKQADGSYKFGTSYGLKDANGKFDGGLVYTDDLSKAGHLFSDFRKLSLSQRGQMSMKNGPRCKSEYDYCVDSAGVTAYYLRAQ